MRTPVTTLLFYVLILVLSTLGVACEASFEEAEDARLEQDVVAGDIVFGDPSFEPAQSAAMQPMKPFGLNQRKSFLAEMEGEKPDVAIEYPFQGLMTCQKTAIPLRVRVWQKGIELDRIHVVCVSDRDFEVYAAGKPGMDGLFSGSIHNLPCGEQTLTCQATNPDGAYSLAQVQVAVTQ